MLIAVSCTVELRFSAVTTISSNPAFSAEDAGPAAGAAMADTQSAVLLNSAANIEVATREAVPSASQNILFINGSP
jgi:hypothetical protein